MANNDFFELTKKIRRLNIEKARLTQRANQTNNNNLRLRTLAIDLKREKLKRLL